MNIKYSSICHMNKKLTIACWTHLLMTYSAEKIPWSFHTSLRSHLKNSCFGFHQAFQTPRNSKSTRPAASCICFSVFGTPDKTLALVVDILHQNRYGYSPCRYSRQRIIVLPRKGHYWIVCSTSYPLHASGLSMIFLSSEMGHGRFSLNFSVLWMLRMNAPS